MLIEQIKEILIQLREKPLFVWWGHQKVGAFPAAAQKPARHDKACLGKLGSKNWLWHLWGQS